MKKKQWSQTSQLHTQQGLQCSGVGFTKLVPGASLHVSKVYSVFLPCHCVDPVYGGVTNANARLNLADVILLFLTRPFPFATPLAV